MDTLTYVVNYLFFLIHFPAIIIISLCHMMHREIHIQNVTQNCTYSHSFFIMCVEFHVARIQTKIC